MADLRELAGDAVGNMGRFKEYWLPQFRDFASHMYMDSADGVGVQIGPSFEEGPIFDISASLGVDGVPKVGLGVAEGAVSGGEILPFGDYSAEEMGSLFQFAVALVTNRLRGNLLLKDLLIWPEGKPEASLHGFVPDDSIGSRLVGHLHLGEDPEPFFLMVMEPDGRGCRVQHEGTDVADRFPDVEGWSDADLYQAVRFAKTWLEVQASFVGWVPEEISGQG